MEGDRKAISNLKFKILKRVHAEAKSRKVLRVGSE
jgi:hypothetical protein